MRRRNTIAREAILKLLTEAGEALSQDAIEAGLSVSINRATVYRTLNRFCDDGIVHRIVAEDGKQYFATGSTRNHRQLPENHLHFQCRLCNSIVCLPGELEITTPQGFEAERLSCIVSGVCKECH